MAYDDEASARRALEAEEIVGYYLIPEDYVDGGDLVYIDPDANPFESSGEQWPVRWLLFVNLLDGDVDLASRVWRPICGTTARRRQSGYVLRAIRHDDDTLFHHPDGL